MHSICRKHTQFSSYNLKHVVAQYVIWISRIDDQLNRLLHHPEITINEEYTGSFPSANVRCGRKHRSHALLGQDQVFCSAARASDFQMSTKEMLLSYRAVLPDYFAG